MIKYFTAEHQKIVHVYTVYQFFFSGHFPDFLTINFPGLEVTNLKLHDRFHDHDNPVLEKA